MNTTLKTKFSFIAATITMTVLCIANSSSVPFFATYQSLYSISNSILSMSTVVYFGGNVIGLLFLTRLSNYLGRRPVIISIILLGILGCLSFVFVDSGILLLFGRLLQGLSSGMAAGSILTYIIETAPENSNLGVIVSTNISLIGFSIGALNSGIVVDNMPHMITDVFLVIIVLFIISMFLILFSKETVKHKKGVLSSLKPEIKVPNNIRRFIPLSIIIFVSTYALTGFYQTFSSSLALLEFGTSSKFLAAVIYASLIAPQIIGGMFIDRFSIRDAQRIGLIGFTVSVVFINITLIEKWLVLFIVFNIISSLFFGLCFTSCMNNLVNRTSSDDMSGVLATVYIITDGGTAVVNLLISGIVHYTSIINISLGYLVVLIIACIVAVRMSGKISYAYD